jgi:hydroxyethylthiazole kinase
MTLNAAAAVIDRIRDQVPLVHALTNYVTINDCANILLAYGASPAMAEAFDETYGFAQLASALYINLGTLTKEQEAAGIQAILGAKKAGTPVIIDPVAVGALPRKRAVLDHLLELGEAKVIKGNGGEILALAGDFGAIRGVDAVGELRGLERAAKATAKELDTVIVATGETDIVTDGERVVAIHNGHRLLTKVTGAGCMTGALIGAAIAVEPDPLIAAVAATASMGIAGELAAEAATRPGSFRVALIDAIDQLTAELFLAKGRIDA